MAVTTVEDQVSALLSRDVVLPKSNGVSNSGLEASAVFESVALNLLLKPRAAIYFELLARNGLLAALQDELAQISSMKKAVTDTANLSFKIEGVPALNRARTALLSLESLPRLDANQVALSTFQNAVQEFLDKHLAKNVRRKGATDLTRPAAEALADLPSLLSQLKTTHAAVLDRLYTLATGFENFLSAPFSALLGNSTISRARQDLEDILAQVSQSGDPSAARDFALRLIAGRAAIKTMASPPDPLADFELTVSTDEAPATATSAPGPWLVPSSPVITVNGSSYNFFVYNAAQLVSDEIVFPLVLDADHADLYLSVDGASLRLPLQGAYSNLSALVSALTQQGVQAAAFGTNRVLLWYPGSSSLSILPLVQLPDTTSTTGSNRLYTKSGHANLGLIIGQVGTRSISARDMADALANVFPSISTVANEDGTVTLSTKATVRGSSLTVASMGWGFLSGTFYAQSSHLAAVGPQLGDLVTLPDGARQVVGVDSTSVELDGSARTYAGPATARSALVTAHYALASRIKSFLKSWSRLSYSQDLTELDRVTAPLLASQSPAQREDALDVLSELETQLTTLLNTLSDTSTMLPTGAASEERTVVEGILTTLTERNYDRAADRLLRCDIQALLEMDQDQASYAGAFLAASSKFAQAGNVPQDTSAVRVVG